MTGWLQQMQDCLGRGEACVLVTVASTRGSTPREVGAKMLVTEYSSAGSIGGGQLEYRCIELARQQILADPPSESVPRSRTFPLGADCGQCCGGVAEILFEPIGEDQPWIGQLSTLVESEEAAIIATLTHASAPFTKLLVTAESLTDNGNAEELCTKVAGMARRLMLRKGPAEKRIVSISGNVKVPVLLEPIYPCDFHITVFGAGHVGSALIRVLGELPCRVTWVDSRRELLQGKVPGNVGTVASRAPDTEVSKAAPGSYFLVMTHSHPLDQAICNRILERGDFAYCGLIGSKSKRRRFEKRFRALGFPEEAFQAITCPIGMLGISSKKPAEIAISVAAELLRVHEQSMVRSSPVTDARISPWLNSGVRGGQ